MTSWSKVIMGITGLVVIAGGLILMSLPPLWMLGFSHGPGFWAFLFSVFAGLFAGGWIVGLGANLILDNRRYLRLGMYSSILGLLGMVLLLGAAVLTSSSQTPRS